MYTDNPSEIEVSDIDAVQRIGDAITLPDGRVALPVLLMLAAHTGKPFGGEGAPAFPTAIHLSNGVQNRMVAIADRTANPVTVEEEAAAAAAVESAPEPSEDAAPVAEEPATEPEPAPAVDEPAAAADEAAPAPAPAEAAVDAPAVDAPADEAAASEPEA